VEQHRVAGTQGQAGRIERGPSVLRCEDITGFQAMDTAHGGNIEQQPAGHDLRKGVDAEPVGAVLLGDIGHPGVPL